MRRFLKTVFLFYMLGLNFIPCEDGEKALHIDTFEVVQSVTDQHHALCSPFCQCQCCHIDILQPQVFGDSPETFSQYLKTISEVYSTKEYSTFTFHPPDYLV